MSMTLVAHPTSMSYNTLVASDANTYHSEFVLRKANHKWKLLMEMLHGISKKEGTGKPEIFLKLQFH